MNTTDNSSNGAEDKYMRKRFISEDASDDVLKDFADYLIGNNMPDNIDEQGREDINPNDCSYSRSSRATKYHRGRKNGDYGPEPFSPLSDAEIVVNRGIDPQTREDLSDFLLDNQLRGDTSYLVFRGRQTTGNIDSEGSEDGEIIDEWEGLTYVLSLTHLSSRQEDKAATADFAATSPEPSRVSAAGDQTQGPVEGSGNASDTPHTGFIRAFVMNPAMHDWDRGDLDPDYIHKLEFRWLPGDHSATRASFDLERRTDGTGLKGMKEDIGVAASAWDWGLHALWQDGLAGDWEQLTGPLFEELLSQHSFSNSSR